MTNSVYSTRAEAIELEVLPALGEFAENFDIDALADEVLGHDKDGYWVKASVGEFYEAAEKYDLTL